MSFRQYYTERFQTAAILATIGVLLPFFITLFSVDHITHRFYIGMCVVFILLQILLLLLAYLSYSRYNRYRS